MVVEGLTAPKRIDRRVANKVGCCEVAFTKPQWNHLRVIDARIGDAGDAGAGIAASVGVIFTHPISGRRYRGVLMQRKERVRHDAIHAHDHRINAIIAEIKKDDSQHGKFSFVEWFSGSGLLSAELAEKFSDATVMSVEPEAENIKASAKLDLLETTLENSIAAGHRTLVFSQWTSLLQRVIPRLDERGWEYHYLDGRTTNRHELVNRWNEPDGPPVFLISLRAGGAGLNLTGADHVIHLDPWWNPAVEDQATDRAHRIGQVKPVVAYRFVARNTVEEKVLALQEKKRDLFDATVEQGRFQLDRLSQADIEDLFTEGGEDETLSEETT